MAKGIGFAEQFTPILGIGFAEHSHQKIGSVGAGIELEDEPKESC